MLLVDRDEGGQDVVVKRTNWKNLNKVYLMLLTNKLSGWYRIADDRFTAISSIIRSNQILTQAAFYYRNLIHITLTQRWKGLVSVLWKHLALRGMWCWFTMMVLNIAEIKLSDINIIGKRFHKNRLIGLQFGIRIGKSMPTGVAVHRAKIMIKKFRPLTKWLVTEVYLQ